jgi:hypothetical protein
METGVTQLIEILEEQSVVYGTSDAPEHGVESIRLQLTANCLRGFRDTLIAIANCRGGVPSHQAQEALIKTGHCAHFNSVYHHRGEDGDESKWRCNDCEKESDSRLASFE